MPILLWFRNRFPGRGLAGLTVIAALSIAFSGCSQKRQINARVTDAMPNTILWAWERPEDLRTIDQSAAGVAFLAQTIFLRKDEVSLKPRRQPLEVPAGTYLIAVTRIETNKAEAERPTLSPESAQKMASDVKRTLDLPDVRAVQIDFDAVASERRFYRLFMNSLKEILPANTPLSMTSLASWCTGDAWFNDLPVDEAVPMVFQMGADNDNIRAFLRNGNDWSEPLCRASYGVSLTEGKFDGMKPARRMWYFNDRAWSPDDLRLLGRAQ